MTDATPFADLADYVAIPRLAGLAVSRDGSRLVTSVATLNRAGTGYVTALWEVDPRGERAAYRLTRSSSGESGATFARNGDLFFTSSRPDPEGEEKDPTAALWMLPAAGGEARVVCSRPGGVDAVLAARDADIVLVSAKVLPGADDEAADATLRERRTEQKVRAILHSGVPVRYWDSDLGPGEDHLFVLETDPEATPSAAPTTVDAMPLQRLRRVTPGMGRGLAEAPVVTPDGREALVTVARPSSRGERHLSVWRIDLATGQRTELVPAEDGWDFDMGVVDYQGRRAVVTGDETSTPQRRGRQLLYLVDLQTGVRTPLAHDADLMFTPQAVTEDGLLVCTADSQGRSPIFTVNLETQEVRQVTRDDAAYSNVVLDQRGRAYALRAAMTSPAAPVSVDLASGEVTELLGPVPPVSVPGRVEEVTAVAPDGTPVRGWLCLPEGAGADQPAPLLLWIHGGPVSSWNAWSWRWSPWLMTAQGYAVLLPDPALSTGYGMSFIQRGWGTWGDAPYTDLMAITDETERREDIDETRTAAMGGSFGGYMANWVAGHTNRFRAIVTHASLWALDQFAPTTDAAMWWRREMDPTMQDAHSPHRHVEQIATPMLVVHGDRDYRVPIGEGLRLWWELLSQSQLAADDEGRTPHRFLYFPDENHWVLKPQHAKVWYGVVNHFLAEHLGGRPDGKAVELPEVLGLTPPSTEQPPTAATGDVTPGDPEV